MGPEDIHQTVQHFRRIIFDNGFDRFRKAAGIPVTYEINDGRAERIIHDRVETIAFEVVFSFVVGDLVGGVLPDFADDERIRLFGFCSAH